MGWRSRSLLTLLGLAGCARLIGLDGLDQEPQGPQEPSGALGQNGGSTSAGGASAGASRVGQAGSLDDNDGDDGGSAGSGEGGSAGSLGGSTPDDPASGGTPGTGGSLASAGSSGVTGTGGSLASAGSSSVTGMGGALASAGSSGVTSAGGSAGSSGAAGATGGVVFSSCPSNLLVNGGFEAGPAPWVSFTTGTDPLIYDSTEDIYEGVNPHGGRWLGWLGGVPSETNRLSQTVSVPAAATQLVFQGSLRVQLLAEHPNIDFLRMRLVIGAAPVPLAQWTNADAGTDWVDLVLPPVDLMPSAEPRSVTLEIESEIGAGPGTYFYVDDLALVPTCPLDR